MIGRLTKFKESSTISEMTTLLEWSDIDITEIELEWSDADIKEIEDSRRRVRAIFAGDDEVRDATMTRGGPSSTLQHSANEQTHLLARHHKFKRTRSLRRAVLKRNMKGQISAAKQEDDTQKSTTDLDSAERANGEEER